MIMMIMMIMMVRKQGLTLGLTKSSHKAVRSCLSPSSHLGARKGEAGAEEAARWAREMLETSPGASQCNSQEIQARMKRKAARRRGRPAAQTKVGCLSTAGKLGCK